MLRLGFPWEYENSVGGWCYSPKDFCFSFRAKQFNVLFSMFPFLFAMQCFQEHRVYLEDFF